MPAPVSLRIATACLAALSAAVVGGGIGGPRVGAAEASSEPTAADVEPAETVTYPVLLLRDLAVRSELKLTREQASSVDALIAQVEYPLFLLRDAPARDRDAALVPIRETLNQKLTAVLGAPQRDRLNQLVFQAARLDGPDLWAICQAPAFIARPGHADHQDPGKYAE